MALAMGKWYQEFPVDSSMGHRAARASWTGPVKHRPTPSHECPGHDERMAKYTQRAAEGLPLFEQGNGMEAGIEKGSSC